MFKLNANREVVDDIANHVYQVSVGLALLEATFGVIPVCDNSITICPCFDPFHPISRDKEWLRRRVRQNGMNNGKKANSSKQLSTIIVRGFLTSTDQDRALRGVNHRNPRDKAHAWRETRRGQAAGETT